MKITSISVFSYYLSLVFGLLHTRLPCFVQIHLFPLTQFCQGTCSVKVSASIAFRYIAPVLKYSFRSLLFDQLSLGHCRHLPALFYLKSAVLYLKSSLYINISVHHAFRESRHGKNLISEVVRFQQQG